MNERMRRSANLFGPENHHTIDEQHFRLQDPNGRKLAFVYKEGVVGNIPIHEVYLGTIRMENGQESFNLTQHSQGLTIENAVSGLRLDPHMRKRVSDRITD